MPWIWDEERELFVETESRRTVSLEEMPELVDLLIAEAWDDLNELLDEQKNPRKIHDAILLLLTDLYLILAALGIGGEALLDEGLHIQIQEMVDRQRGYLDNLISQYRRQQIGIGELRRRARMYLNSTRSAYWHTRDEFERRRGMVEEHWWAVGDRNTCNPCLEAEREGWVQIGIFGQPGSGIVMISPTTMCDGLTSCRCTKTYR